MEQAKSLQTEEPSVRLVVDKDHAELIIHTPGIKINKLDRKAFTELNEHIHFLKAKAKEIKTVLIWSDKKDMFLAGADIEEIQSMTKPEQALEMVENVQAIFQELAELPQITLAAIHGPCLGGGLELSLACDYRICSDSEKTKIGLPEIQLGVIPGAGGTQRLPRVVGLVQGITMITSAQPVDSRKALKIGLVSDVVPEENLIQYCRELLQTKKYSKFETKTSFLQGVVEHTPLKKIVFNKARKTIEAKTKGHYPAPLRALDVIEKTFNKEIKFGLQTEAQVFAELAVTPTAKNLINLFFNMEALKKERGVGAMEAPNFKPEKIQEIGVLGAGIMGGGIAAVASKKGIGVRLKDISHESILTALSTAQKLFDRDLSKRKIKKAEWNKRRYRIQPTTEWNGFKHLPFVIEAVVENMDIKKKVLAELQSKLPEGAIIASNTSSLSISEMAATLKYPDKVVGMHFFNPVPMMPLVEVIRGEQTSPETIVQTVALGRQMGKTVIVVKDRPGFLINRILMPYLIECAHLQQEGFSISQIDKVATRFGMPMGPFRLLDEVGLDTGAKVAKVIAGAFPHMQVTNAIDEMVEKGYLGKKNGKGFYVYDAKGKSKGVRPEFKSAPKNPGGSTDQLLVDRLILPMVAEAIMTLDEGIVESARELDLGLIFGIGFPPFRGGLLKWVSDEGERKILDRLNAIHNATKGRVPVPESLKTRAQNQHSFYPKAV